MGLRNKPKPMKKYIILSLLIVAGGTIYYLSWKRDSDERLAKIKADNYFDSCHAESQKEAREMEQELKYEQEKSKILKINK